MFHHAESPSIIMRQYKDKGHISHPHERPQSTSTGGAGEGVGPGKKIPTPGKTI